MIPYTNMCVLRFLLLVSSFGFFSCQFRQKSQVEKLENAIQAQDKGQNEEAIKLYQEVLKDGVVNGHLFYNLGIAYYKSSQLGEAMAAFLAAKRYLPRHPDVKSNLKFVQNKIQDKLEAQRSGGIYPQLETLTGWFTKREISYLALSVTVVASFLCSLGILIPRYQGFSLVGGMGIVISFLLCSLLALKWVAEPRWGAIKSQELAKVYSGPGETHMMLFQIQVGAPVFLSGEKRQNYLQIELSDGKRGWVDASQVAFFGE